MESKKKYINDIYWIVKYLGFGIVFGAIFEILGLGLDVGVVVAICIVLFDDIYIDKKCKDKYLGNR